MTKGNKYVVGINMPGYMPDNPPSEFPSYMEGLLGLICELENSMLHIEDEPASNNQMQALKRKLKKMRNNIQTIYDTHDINKPEPEQNWGFTIGQYHYWLTINP